MSDDDFMMRDDETDEFAEKDEEEEDELDGANMHIEEDDDLGLEEKDTE